jgi:phage terminase Nu1 subunit (DNA packaging protein)
VKKSKKDKPKTTFSTSAMAHIIGVSVQRVGQLEREGIIHKTAHGQYALEAITEFCEHQRKMLQDSAGSPSLAAERAELTHEKVLIARMERLALEKELIPARDIAPAFNAIGEHIKARMLAIPQRFAAKFGMVKTAVEAQALLKSEIHWALDELSQTIVVRPGNPTDAATV